MRNIFAVAVVILATLVPGAASAQHDGAAVLEDIRGAFSEGDVERLMRRSGERIDLTVFGVSELLSRSQARYVLRSFFAEYPPTMVALVDTSESEGNWFASAGYWYETGKAPLSVYLRLRRGSAEWELRELRFDRPAAR